MNSLYKQQMRPTDTHYEEHTFFVPFLLCPVQLIVWRVP